MEITRPFNPHATLNVTSATPLPAAWRAGQRLAAVVESRLATDLYTLRIGDTQIQARTGATLLPRQRLTLEVVQPGPPPLLRITAAPPTPPAAGILLAQIMRTALPAQAPLPQVFAALATLLREAKPGALPAEAAKLIEQALEQSPRARALAQTDTLKTALLNSGIFLEQKLARGKDMESDRKAMLLRALATLQRAAAGTPSTSSTVGDTNPPGDPLEEALRHTVAGLARIQLHQCATLAPEPDAAQTWVFELPFRQGQGWGGLQLRIEKESRAASNDEEARWSICFTLELERLGPLHVRMTWLAGALSASLWTEFSSAGALVAQHLERLRENLRGAGLRVTDLSCHEGRPPFVPVIRPPVTGHQLLNVST